MNNQKEKSVSDKLSNKQSGQSVLEIIVAMFIIMMSLSAVVIVSFGNQSVSIDTGMANPALFFAREGLESARAEARENFSVLSNSSVNDGDYLKEIAVEDINTYKKKVTSRVSWQTDPLRPQKIELVTIITDWPMLLVEGGGGGLTGDWLNPETAGTVDLGPGNAGNDIVVKDSTVFMAAAASDPKKDDFYSIDVANINSPAVLKSINTGKGLKALAVFGNYAYAAHLKSSSQLQVINIGNPSNPALITSKTLQGNGEEGLSIFAVSGYVYVGTEDSSGAEFQIYDTSDPSNPTFVGSYETDTDINDIYVLKNRAYLATSNDNAEIIILDISNPASPQLLANYDEPGTSDGLSVFVNGFNTVFAGIGSKLVIIDSANIDSLAVKGRYDALGNVNDIYIRDYLAFLATSDSNKEFQAVNISNLSNPLFYSSYNFPQSAAGNAYHDNVLYTAVRSNDALRIITSSP